MKTLGNADGHSHRASKSKSGSGRKSGPVTIHRAHKLAWLVALEKVNNRSARLFVLADGSVIVANSERRPAWL